MDLTPSQQQALSLWNELGMTTPTHPVLDFALKLYFEPFGLTCDALRYDALAALDNPDIKLEFIEPRFEPGRVDRSWSNFSTVEPLLGVSDLITPIFLPDGTLEDFRLLKEIDASAEEPSAEQKRVTEFLDNHAEALYDLAEALSSATKLYIDATLEMLIRKEEASSDMASLFIKNPRHFGEIAFQLFTTK